MPLRSIIQLFTGLGGHLDWRPETAAEPSHQLLGADVTLKNEITGGSNVT